MPSQALQTLVDVLGEVPLLAQSTASPLRRPRAKALEVARVVGRAQVMLLSSHFERYVYSANEEAVTYLNQARTPSERIPERLRLLHSAQVIDVLGGSQWEHRGDALTRFVASDGWLWTAASTGDLAHERLLTWMKAPNSKNLLRYYKLWGIDDVFSTITRSQAARGRIFLRVQELVDRRNDIAHGDYSAQATHLDLIRYLGTVRTFCTRADRILGKAVGKMANDQVPW